MWRNPDWPSGVPLMRNGTYCGVVWDGVFHKAPPVPIDPEFMKANGFTEEGGESDSGEADSGSAVLDGSQRD